MFNRVTASSQQLLNRLSGNTVESASREYASLGVQPTMVLLEHPMEDVDAAVEKIMEADPVGRRVNRRLRRQAARGARVGVSEGGKATLDGRECCAVLARTVDRALPYMEMPTPVTCPECGARYSVEMRAREIRRHV